MRLYTIGHSNHSLDVFTDWLVVHGISLLFDIRRYPGSRRLPQLNQGSLRRGLAAAGIDYHWYGESLGGRREGGIDTDGLEALPEGALRNFAAHMNSTAFRVAIDESLRLASVAPAAFMCAERDPGRCHRQLISDYLVLQGHEILHITGMNSTMRHQPNPVARLEADRIYYDRGTQPELDW
ncbi:MAG: DUF488 domain-containing protein [Gammaproteobacteria bacterium]|nr:DUF488 domain-containing protein [Gammaproteobacteria bacterium]